jgi:Flp pilus assembly protein TadG
LVAVCLVALLGVAALAIDGGVLVDQRRRVQAAADAAALAAADDLYYRYQTGNGLDGAGTATASALSTAAANGYNNDGITSIVTVNIPAASGIVAKKPGTAEVIVQYNEPRFFSGVFGTATTPVTARAVAMGRWASFNSGILVLNPTGPGTLSATGNGQVSLAGAQVIVNSSDSQGAINSGSGNLTVNGLGGGASAFNFAGTPGYQTTGSGQFSGTIQSGATPTADPLRYLPSFDSSTLSVQSNQTLTISGYQNTTLNPGVYQGGIAIGGAGDVTMNPGVYYMAGGGFSYTGWGNLYGDKVMIYNAPVTTSDAVNIAGQGKVTMTPLDTGLYQGMAIFQDRTSSVPVTVTGNRDMKITGTFYAARAPLNITAISGGNTIGSQYISYNLTFAGNGNINVNWQNNPSANGRAVGLVE